MSQSERINPMVMMGELEIFDWQKIIDIRVENLFDPFKKKKYDTLLHVIDQMASTVVGRDLLLKIYDTHGALTITEGKIANDLHGPAMSYENNMTSYYDFNRNQLNIDFDELDAMVFPDEETGEDMKLSMEYVVLYLLVEASEPKTEQYFPELKHYSNHVRH